MNKLIIVAFILISGFTSCSKNDDLKSTDDPSGIYTEISPFKGRTQLVFIEGSRVIKISEGSSISDEFHYEINGNKIKFTSVGNDPYTSEIYFERIDESTFKTGNLYVSIPENPPVYLLFRKVQIMQY